MPPDEVVHPVPLARLDGAPHFGLREAERLAREHFGLDGEASPLTSERDQNFLIQSPRGDSLVLKIASAWEDPALIDAQQRAMMHLAPTLRSVPAVLPNVRGELAAEIAATDGRRHTLWAVSRLPGTPLGAVRRRSVALLEDVGRTTGALSRGLQGFDHAAIHREFHWDLAKARRLIAEQRGAVSDLAVRAAIDRLMGEIDRFTAPLLPSLRQSAIHNDLNDYNVLVGGGDDVESHNQHVTGIVDFGDMVFGYTVADLAVAIAYAVLDAPDPLATAAAITRGYHSAFAPTEEELGALFGLVALRLCASACIAVSQRQQQPGNAYLGISQESIRRTIPRLAAIPFRLAEAAVRDACGLEPVAANSRVVSWLEQQGEFEPILDIDLGREPCAVIDLGVGSVLIGGDERDNAEPLVTERIFGAMRRAGIRVAVGRYDEPRLLYLAPAFAISPRITDEKRTLHIGLDLFAEAGTPVFAPLEGVVHAFADNNVPQDYGAVIVLRHSTDDGTAFCTLYGHLSRGSLAPLSVGQPVTRGQQIATLGTPAENGGWTPHLHLQILTDTLDLDTDFPGVAPVSQRAVWLSLSPDPNLLVGVPAARFPRRAPTKAETLAARRERVGRNLSVSYLDPVKVVRGWKQYLFDEGGRRYLDAYNNVAHVGHCHPRIAKASREQMALLNTNTRYLSDLLPRYAARLAATLPRSLSTCFFLNSASEANELALRLARAYTRQRDMIVLEAAYHGNTTTLIELSPYKHAGPGGAGAPDWVHVAPLPDDYRGAYKRSDAHAGRLYARRVVELIGDMRERGRHLAGFVAETCPSVGGQIILPHGYLEEVYRDVRAAGGVCIADEVQTGLGRLGTHFWAFEAHGVVPDIVVMGKPLGNGHPLAAVATTPEIAAAFDNGMEFFSTFGGNTVSCAVGLAVLDVVREEGLQANALRVGERLLSGLHPLIEQFELVGDVRGSGLFLGVELVKDRTTLEPATSEASFVANRMRERGILLGTDGRHHNVVKIRPPMPCTLSDADLLVECLAESLSLIQP